MAESEFSAEAKAHFREICQREARQRANANFPEDGPDKERFYETSWRRSYAAYVGDDIPKRCPCCGR